MESEDGKIPIFDVLVKISTNGTLDTAACGKPARMEQILRFHGNYPDKPKQSCIQTLFAGTKILYSIRELGKQKENCLLMMYQWD